MNVKECVVNCIKTLTAKDKNQIKIMLNHGVLCCVDYAKSHNIDPVLFNEELKQTLNGGK